MHILLFFLFSLQKSINPYPFSVVLNVWAIHVTDNDTSIMTVELRSNYWTSAHHSKPESCTRFMYCHCKIHLSYPRAIKVITNCRKPRKHSENRSTVFTFPKYLFLSRYNYSTSLCQKVARSWISRRMAQTCPLLLKRLESACKRLWVRGQTITHVFWRSLFPWVPASDDKNGVQNCDGHDRITMNVPRRSLSVSIFSLFKKSMERINDNERGTISGKPVWCWW